MEQFNPKQFSIAEAAKRFETRGEEGLSFTQPSAYSYSNFLNCPLCCSVAAVIANMVMEDVGQRALATSQVKSFFWKRYVDDVISLVSYRIWIQWSRLSDSPLSVKKIDICPSLI